MTGRAKKSKKPAGVPMWAQLRVAYDFATPKERAQFEALSKKILSRKDVELCAACEPTGCESSGSTGGCKPGTGCLFSGLQS
jgi:hypothetical protein